MISTIDIDRVLETLQLLKQLYRETVTITSEDQRALGEAVHNVYGYVPFDVEYEIVIRDIDTKCTPQKEGHTGIWATVRTNEGDAYWPLKTKCVDRRKSRVWDTTE